MCEVNFKLIPIRIKKQEKNKTLLWHFFVLLYGELFLVLLYDKLLYCFSLSLLKQIAIRLYS